MREAAVVCPHGTAAAMVRSLCPVGVGAWLIRHLPNLSPMEAKASLGHSPQAVMSAML